MTLLGSHGKVKNMLTSENCLLLFKVIFWAVHFFQFLRQADRHFGQLIVTLWAINVMQCFINVIKYFQNNCWLLKASYFSKRRIFILSAVCRDSQLICYLHIFNMFVNSEDIHNCKYLWDYCILNQAWQHNRIQSKKASVVQGMLEKKDNLNANKIKEKLTKKLKLHVMSALHPLHIISGTKHKNTIVIIRGVLMTTEV